MTSQCLPTVNLPKSSRMAALLGEMSRMVNGAVASSMRFYGAEYGLNYGVSLPTIRDIAKREVSNVECDSVANHALSHLLYRQEVRELKLAAFWLADGNLLCEEGDFDFWFNGIINSEVAEEAAFALFGRAECNGVAEQLLARSGDNSELLHYCAMLTLARQGVSFDYLLRRWPAVVAMLSSEESLLPKGVVVLLESLIKQDVPSVAIESLVEQLPDGKAKSFVKEEISWRLEFR